MFQAQSFFYSKQKGFLFQEFWAQGFCIPSKGFFISRILSKEFFNSKHGIFFVLPREHGMFYSTSKGVFSYFKNFEHRVAWNWVWRHLNNTLIIWFL
jgi:hypothetical protein